MTFELTLKLQGGSGEPGNEANSISCVYLSQSFLLFHVQHQLPVLLHTPHAQLRTHHLHTVSTCANTVIAALTSHCNLIRILLGSYQYDPAYM